MFFWGKSGSMLIEDKSSSAELWGLMQCVNLGFGCDPISNVERRLQ